MARQRADLINHPVRSRILAALLGRNLTTQQIADLLPDVPLPSIYRHVRTLADAGVLETAEEVRVNGALTKVYGVRRGQALVRQEDIPDATAADRLRFFTTFLNTLADMYRTYLERRGAETRITQEPEQSIMTPLNLSPEEYERFSGELKAFLRRWRDRPVTDERRRVIFAHAVIPDLPAPPLAADPIDGGRSAMD
jgi:DNA-binding transcriptional ArsR family regulator